MLGQQITNRSGAFEVTICDFKNASSCRKTAYANCIGTVCSAGTAPKSVCDETS